MIMPKTHLWKRQNGNLIPIEHMDNDYIKNAYRRCVETIYGNEYLVNKDGQGRTISDFKSPMTKEYAEKWKALFEEEAKKRKIRLPKVDKETYFYELGQRMIRKDQKYLSNKKFDENFL